MKQVYKINDNIIDFFDTIVIEDDTDIPEGYVIPDENARYKSDGTIMTQEELDALQNVQQEPSELDILKAEKTALQETVDLILTEIIPSLLP